jgi:NitT/TauT family transport system substrate-binding protein
MRVSPARLVAVALTGSALALAACGGGDGATTETADAASPATGGDTEAAGADDGAATPVRLQLQWFAQAQFAGYYAAVAEGFYADEGLEVEILEGAVDIVPQQVVATGGAEFGVAWVPKALVSNTEGAGLVNVAQVFQRSGTRMVSWADSGIAEPADWAGRPVGNWGFGNEYELTAAIEQEGVEGAELVAQNFDMEALLNREIDAAQAMTYNEYAQLLETVDPETGELYQPEDFTVIDFNDVGTAMLQDALWVTEDYAAENGDTIEAFLRATFRGWAFCRDEPDTCVDHVLDAGPTLGESHQTWQMNEVNKLIWPSDTSIGVMDPEQWAQTVEIASSQIPELEGQEIPDTSYTTEFSEAAVAALEEDGVDVTGDGWEPVEVELREGGE